MRSHPSLLLFALAGCAPSSGPPADALFVDVTRELGLPVPEGVPPDGIYDLPELMQGGIGLFDYDGDGDLDLLYARAPLPAGRGATIENQLFRQESDGRFIEVAAEAGLSRPGCGQGLAIGDVDNDGDPDVYLANYGADEFYRNNGDGTFTRATAQAGFAGDRWSTACSFFDYDGDGFLDLYVAHYLRYDPDKKCWDPRDRQEYCGPWAFRGQADKLYRNQGDGTFEDVTAAAGIVLPERGARATGLGVLCTDFTDDGLPDVFVANDLQSNQLWVNQGDGTFREEGILRGVAADQYGHPEASMGVTAGDADGDGALDIFMTHLWHENNRLFLGGKGFQFEDGTVRSKMGRHDLERTGWGCGFADFDHDGDIDLAVANGGVRRRPPLEGAPPGMWSEYAEPNQLFLNDGTGEFALLGVEAGTFGTDVEVSRSLAFGDLEGDGDVDLIVSNIDNTLRVFRNDAPAPGSHWLGVRVLTHGRDALGAQVRVQAGGRERCGAVLPGASYLSSNDPRVHFGLGAATAVDQLVVVWSDGEQELFRIDGVDRWVTVERGTGERP